MSCFTLHDLRDTYGISRRTVQGYEKAGLVSATGRTKYGHLLYDEEAQKKILRIRLYQQLGFSIRSITELISASDETLAKAVEIRILGLKSEKKHMEEMIERAEELLLSLREK